MSSVESDGDIILKEKRIGSTPRERLYVKAQGQSRVVVINSQEESFFWKDWLQNLFLPKGYPNSVSKDYLAYQIWDTAQAFCSTIAGLLATQEVLRGVGVGDSAVTPLTATIVWILKDGCGHVGKIIFAYSHGSYLDAYSKKWRIYADILNDAAMCIEIAIPLFKTYSAFALCLSTIMKAIVGVAGGATRAAMTQHHAIQGNLADVSAKDSSQETAVNLIASVAVLCILTTFGDYLIIFMIMLVLHVMFNYLAVRAVCLRTLNEPRFLLAIDMYLRHEIIATPCQINRCEPIIFYQMGSCLLDLKLSGFRIKLGRSLKNTIRKSPKATHLNALIDIYSKRKYVLVPDINHRTMDVLLKTEAEVEDILCAYFHATLLAVITCALNDISLPIYKSKKETPFRLMCETLQGMSWSRHECHCDDSSFAYMPSYELMNYLNRIVQVEWLMVKNGLKKAGWDLSKHLLIAEQWRITTSNLNFHDTSDYIK